MNDELKDKKEVPKLVENFGSAGEEEEECNCEGSCDECEDTDSRFDPEQCEQFAEPLLRPDCVNKPANPAKHLSHIPMVDDSHFFTGEKIVTIGFANGMSFQCGKITPDKLELYMKYDIPTLSYFNEQTGEQFSINFAMVAMVIAADERLIEPGSKPTPNIVQPGPNTVQ